jgi:GntR family transcriptional regulator
MAHESVSSRLHRELSQIISTTDAGQRLPTEPVLAKQLGVSRATLREAMRTFETQGLIRRRQGSGTYVIHPPGVIESGLEVLESIETQAKRIGLPVQMGKLTTEYRLPDSDEAKNLNIGADQEILILTRVINLDTRPIAYLIDKLPAGILSIEELEQFSGSVLDLLLKGKVYQLAGARTGINAVSAPSEIAKALGIQRGDVLLHFTSCIYTVEGRILTHSFSYFLPGYFNFQVNRRIN